MSDTEYQLIRQTVESYRDLKDTVIRTLSRNMEPKQQVMIIRQAITSTTAAWNRFFSSRISDEEKFVDTLFEISQILQSTMNKIPGDPSFRHTYIRLQSVYNICLIGICFNQGYEGRFRLQGAATILATLLTKQPNPSELVIPQQTDPEYANTIELYSTYFLSTGVMFTSVIKAVPNLNFSELEQWAKQAVTFLLEAKALTDNLDFRHLFKYIYNEETRLYANLSILHQWQFHLIRSVVLFASILGNPWIRSVLEENSLYFDNPVQQTFILVNDNRQSLFDILEQMLDQNILNINNQPTASPHLKYIDNFMNFDITRNRLYTLYSSISQVDNLKNAVESIDFTAIQTGYYQIKLGIEQAASTDEVIFKPEDTEYYVGILQDILTVQMLSHLQNNFVDTLQEIQIQFFDSVELVDLKNYPQIIFYALLLRIVSLSYNDDQDYRAILRELETIGNELTFLPRYHISTHILTIIIKLHYSILSRDELGSLLDSVDIIINNSGQGHLTDEFEQYSTYLINLLDDQSIPYTPTAEVHPSDFLTWMLPQLSHRHQPIVYIPFNAQHRKVIF